MEMLTIVSCDYAKQHRRRVLKFFFVVINYFGKLSLLLGEFLSSSFLLLSLSLSLSLYIYIYIYIYSFLSFIFGDSDENLQQRAGDGCH